MPGASPNRFSFPLGQFLFFYFRARRKIEKSRSDLRTAPFRETGGRVGRNERSGRIFEALIQLRCVPDLKSISHVFNADKISSSIVPTPKDLVSLSVCKITAAAAACVK